MASNILRNIFRSPRYFLVAIVTAFIVFTFSVWLPNLKLVQQILFSSSVSLGKKLSVLLSLYGSIQTNFTVISATYTVLIAILFGLNVSLLLYYIKQRKGGVKNSGVTTLGGLVSGLFGIGCAACGTFLLSSILGLVGAAGLISFLPLGGEEFGLLGVALLIWSTRSVYKKIKTPQVCEI